MVSNQVILILLYSLLLGCSGGGEQKNPLCDGIDVCLKYSSSDDISISSWYWFDAESDQCVAMSKDCVELNLNKTFKSVEKCQEVCEKKDVIDNKNTDVTDCDSTTGGCDKDMAPTSSTVSKPISAIIAISCSVGGIALVAVVIATAYVIRKRKQDHHQKYLEDMLHFWSSDTDDSSEYSSYDDNPEDNNLFDRLERKW